MFELMDTQKKGILNKEEILNFYYLIKTELVKANKRYKNLNDGEVLLKT